MTSLKVAKIEMADAGDIVVVVAADEEMIIIVEDTTAGTTEAIEEGTMTDDTTMVRNLRISSLVLN